VRTRDDGIRDAATVIVARESPEGPAVFMVRRHAGATFLPDRYVFPGGAVDPEDRALVADRLRGSAGAVDPAYVITAARETFEEVGLLFADRAVAPEALVAARRALLAGELGFAGVLARLGVRIDADRLRYFSRWITPKDELAPRRFDARFFVARAPADQVAEADAGEVHDGAWYRPLEALHAYERGEIELIFPTIKHLERIAPYRSVEELLAFAASKPVAAVMPTVDGDRVFTIPRELENAW
jgi:8-oxo-dGTP pyrophosphatase MutT (NUDIX family)